MWQRYVLFSAVLSTLLALSASGSAQAAGDPRDASVLPLTRLRIYETGIAYFERQGKVRAGASVSLPLAGGHLDDALKTLVLLKSDGDVEVSGIEFETALTRAKASAMLGVVAESEAPALDLVQLLDALRGVKVEIRLQGERLQGQVLGVVRADVSLLHQCRAGAQAGTGSSETEERACARAAGGSLTLQTVDGALRRIRLDDVKSVAAVDPVAKKSLGAALNVLSAGNASRRRELRLEATKGGELALGYLGEAPLWRASYRLLLPEREAAPTLQAWALLHNDSDENWRNLEVELVNGRPDSYLFPLAGPRYSPRRLVTPDRALPSVGQLMGRTVDDLYGDELAGIFGTETGVGYGGGGLGLAGVGSTGHGQGTAIGSEETDLLEVGNLASSADAEGVERGSLFEYVLPERVTLSAHSSLLVPLLTRPLEVDRFVRFDGAGESGQSVLSVSNTTDHTLPSGPLAVYADGGFAGESALRRLKPGQSQLLSFGTELDLSIEETERSESDAIRAVHFRSGKLELHSVRERRLVYQLTNTARHEKTALLRLALVNNAKVSGAKIYYEADRQVAYAILPSPAASEKRVALATHEGVRRVLDLPDISIYRLRKYASDPALPLATRTALERAAKALDRAYDVKFRTARVRAGLTDLYAESTRLQQLIKTIRANEGASNQEWMRRLLALESRIRVTANELSRLERQDLWAPVRAALVTLPGP